MTRWITVVAILSLVLGAGVAQADMWGTLTPPAWTTPFVDDADGDQVGLDGRDIDAIYWQRDDTYDYFRMTLNGLPQSAAVRGDGDDTDWAVLYGMYMDAAPGGPAGSDIGYVPDEFDGIDFILDAHFTDGSAGGQPETGLDNVVSHFHSWDPTALGGAGAYEFIDLADSEFLIVFTEVGTPRYTIDWRLTTETLGPNYVLCGATSDENVDPTWDVTECERVPEPATMALMGLGLAGLAAFRKRRKED